MSIFRLSALFLTACILSVVSGGLPIPGIAGPSEALAQQFNQPFQYRVRNNSTAANLAIYLKQIQDGSSSTTAGSAGSTGSLGSITQYSSTTIGNMTEITTILEQGAEGYVDIEATQDGSNSSQSSSAEGTQILGGNTVIANEIENVTATNTTTETENGGETSETTQ